MTRIALLCLLGVFLLNAYLRFAHGAWFDDHGYVATAFHLLGGYLVAMLVYSATRTMYAHLLFSRRMRAGLSLTALLARGGPRMVAALAGITLIVGVGWELFELVFDRLAYVLANDLWRRNGPFIGPPLDSLADLATDALGSVAFAARHWQGDRQAIALAEEEAPTDH